MPDGDAATMVGYWKTGLCEWSRNIRYQVGFCSLTAQFKWGEFLSGPLGLEVVLKKWCKLAILFICENIYK